MHGTKSVVCIAEFLSVLNDCDRMLSQLTHFWSLNNVCYVVRGVCATIVPSSKPLSLFF